MLPPPAAPGSALLRLAFSPAQPVPPHVMRRTCVSCRHFEPLSSVCQLFGTMDVATGDVRHSPVADTRAQADMCGPAGRHHSVRPGGDAADRLRDVDALVFTREADDPIIPGPGDEGLRSYSPDGFYWLPCDHQDGADGDGSGLKA